MLIINDVGITRAIKIDMDKISMCYFISNSYFELTEYNRMCLFQKHENTEIYEMVDSGEWKGI